jgi:hypothetical protein
MNIRQAVVAAAAVVGALGSMPAAAAACTDTFDLGSMGPPAAAALYNQFDQAQSFADCYNFSLNNSADAFGLSVEWDWSLAKGIDVTSVSLSGTGLSGTVSADSPDAFSFGNLSNGIYQLIISGFVTDNGWRFLDGPVGYVGVLATHQASKVPEPNTFALLAIGLGIAGWAGRRKAAAGQRSAA